MIIVTGGNQKFRKIIAHSMSQCEKLGYQIEVYDLLGLGFGKKWAVNNALFQERGYYHQMSSDGWTTKAMHKPGMVEDAMLTHKGEFITYLDGDAVLMARIDEIVDDCDVGVTIRPDKEMKEMMNDALSHNDRDRALTQASQINAGVLFFAGTEQSFHFVTQWRTKTVDLGNDQLAVNKLVNPNNRQLRAWETYTIANHIRVKVFPGEIYNYTNFSSTPPGDAKIYHYKGNTWMDLIR